MIHTDLRQHSSLAAIAAAAAAENHIHHQQQQQHLHHQTTTTSTSSSASSANTLPQSSFPQKTPFAIQELLGLTNDQNESNDLKSITNNHIEACTGKSIANDLAFEIWKNTCDVKQFHENIKL